MIRKINPKTKNELEFLVNFIKENKEQNDFYFTADNKRVYIDTVRKFKNLLKESSYCLLSENEDSDYGVDGILITWNSIGGDKKRHYLKFVTENENALINLLRVFSWDNNIDLFCKLNKNHKKINTLKSKGFKFRGLRGFNGQEILLLREKRNFKRG